MVPWFTCVGLIFYVPHNCYWRFEACEASLIAPGGTLFPKSNGGTQIQWLGFFPKTLNGISPTHFGFLYKTYGEIDSPFLQVFKFLEIPNTWVLNSFLRHITFQPSFFQQIFENFSQRYQKLSYILVPVNLYYFRTFPFLLGLPVFTFFIYKSSFVHPRSSKWVDLLVW